jgi:hypothetical protein
VSARWPATALQLGDALGLAPRKEGPWDSDPSSAHASQPANHPLQAAPAMERLWGMGHSEALQGPWSSFESRQDRPRCTADQIQRVQSMRDCARTDPTGPLLLSAMVTGDDG